MVYHTKGRDIFCFLFFFLVISSSLIEKTDRDRQIDRQTQTGRQRERENGKCIILTDISVQEEGVHRFENKNEMSLSLSFILSLLSSLLFSFFSSHSSLLSSFRPFFVGLTINLKKNCSIELFVMTSFIIF